MRHQPLLGAVISTELGELGRPRPPVLFEPPFPLVTRPEVWIATVGPPNWGGADVLMSEEDDDYRHHVGSMSAQMVMGTLLDPIPAAAAHEAFAPVDFRVRLHGPRELMATTPHDATARTSDVLIGSGPSAEVVSTTMVRLVDMVDGDHVYRCTGPLIRGGYGTGRTATWDLCGHAAGETFVRLNRRVFRVGIEARHVGRRLWFKLAARNEHADPDATEDPSNVDPVWIDVRGEFYRRDPRRAL